MADIDRDRIWAVIGRLAWRFAATMPHMPHEYAVRSPENEPDYVALFQAVQQHGVREWGPDRPGKRRYRNRYFEPGDGWRYWCMTSHMPSSHVINRARVADP